MTWAIYYADGSRVTGDTAEEWRRAPEAGVQVVVLYEPYPDGRCPWRGVDDRQLWTGDDEYSLFGWGPKYGTLIDRSVYDAIWERACGDR